MKKITRVIIALISFSLFANFFFFRTITPFSTGLLLLGFCLYIFVVAEHRYKSMIVLAGTCLFGLGVLSVRAGHFVQTQTILTLIAASASLWYVSISESESFQSFTAVFLAPFFAGLSYLKRAFSLLRPSILSTGYKQVVLLFGDKKKHSQTTSTLIGLIIALPVMLILLLMFSSADPIYYSYLKNILSPEFLQELPMRIFLSLLLIILITPFVFPRIRRIFFSPGQLLSKIQMAHELTIVMAIISLVIASFIIIQWPYVFANVKAETDLSRYGVATYAEYVKKGFIELLRVSAFIYVLLWLGLTALRQKATKSKALYIFQWIVLGEFLIILISIARRVYLYQLYHGLTLIRVYGSFFLVWLTCMAITLAIRHLTHKIRFGYLEGAITIILFVVLGTWNVEGYIVTTHPPTVNKRTDYVYLSRMSADGAKGWVMAYAHAKQIIEKYSLTTGEIDKNGRREIAYAEYILRQMTNKEYEYMGKYASPAEMKTYIGALVDFQTERFEKERVDLLAYIKKQPTDTWTKDRLVEIEKLKKEVNKINSQSLTNSNKSPIDNAQITDIVVNWWQQTIKPFEAASSPFFESFYDTSAAPQYYGPPDQSSLMENGNIATRYVKTSTLDRLFMKNRSDMKAFTLMKQAMPIAQLHSLQTMYYQLYDRIAQQSARDFETDISLESPLL